MHQISKSQDVSKGELSSVFLEVKFKVQQYDCQEMFPQLSGIFGFWIQERSCRLGWPLLKLLVEVAILGPTCLDLLHYSIFTCGVQGMGLGVPHQLCMTLLEAIIRRDPQLCLS
jgi:hypothetical protein